MPVTPQTRAMVLLAANICDEKKATDTRILELDPVDAGFTDFFIITSATNNRQTGAIADEIELRMKREFGTYAKSVEGRRGGEWILLDYIDFVVHVFTEQTREFYDIERLRKSARSMDADELAAMLQERTEAVRKKAPGKKALASKEPVPATLAEQTPAEQMPETVPAQKAPTKAAKKTPAKTAGKSPAKKAPAKAPAKAAKKSPAKKSSAKKAPAKRAAKSAAPISATRKAAKSAAGHSTVEDAKRRTSPSGAPARKRLPAPGASE